MAAEVATAKAFTAAVGMSGESVEQLFAPHPQFVAAATTLFHGNFMPGQGGVPGIVDGKLIGGVGASGGSGEQDEDVAQSAATQR